MSDPYLTEKSHDTPTSAPAPGVHDVFMLGWEFPPFISGGLGTACYGLTKAMSRRGDRVVFVMPGPTRPGFTATWSAENTRHASAADPAVMSMPEFDNVEFRGLSVDLSDPYARPAPDAVRDAARLRQRPADLPTVHDLAAETRKFSDRAAELALRLRQQGRDFDVVHAHDWMTFAAGEAAARALGVPLVVHVHSTEFDRAGPDADDQIIAAERAGLYAANRIIAVSDYTASLIASRYGIEREHIAVIHNALDADNRLAPERPVQIGAGERVVLFLGRITQQKGPEYFVKAAKRVLDVERAVRFVMSGTGDQFTQVRHLARQLEIEQHFLFTGFLRNEDVDEMFRAADVFVMPSVSEPFGIVSLEAMGRDVPTIVSKQSGAAEVLENALKVDFWDVEEMASKIVSVLRDPTLASQLGERGSFEVRQMRWSDAADAVAGVYEALGR